MKPHLVIAGYIAAAAVAVFVVKRVIDGARGAAGDLLGGLRDAAADAETKAREAVQSMVDSVENVAKAPFTPAAPPWSGSELPEGWTRVKTPYGEFVTQYPGRITQTKLDVYATVDP